jgi:hypothetical protein
MSLVKGLARPVPDFAKLHALEEQRVARWKRQHKKELTGSCLLGAALLLWALPSARTLTGPCVRAVPKEFRSNPAPPKDPPPGRQNAHDNEWLSDRERQKEREERLAYATRAAAEQREQQEAANVRPTTAAARRPSPGTSDAAQIVARPYSAKLSKASHEDDASSSPYAARTGSAAPPATVQAYAMNMASRSPNSAADPGRTGSSSSRFVSKVKDAAFAVAEEQHQGGEGEAQRVGAPSAQMLYPTAFKGSRGYVSVVEGNRGEARRPAHVDANNQGVGLPRRHLPQQHESSGLHRDQERESEAQRSRPTSAQYSRPGTAGRAREVQGAQAAMVPPPWEVPQERMKGLSLNEMVLGGVHVAPRGPQVAQAHVGQTGTSGSPQKGGIAGVLGATYKGGNETSPPLDASGPLSAQRFRSDSNSSEVSRAPNRSDSNSSEVSRAPTATPHERLELPPSVSNGKVLERPSSAVKRLPEARPSTAGRRRFSDVDSAIPQLDGRGTGGSVGLGSVGGGGGGANAHMQVHPPRDTLVPSSAAENGGLMRSGASDNGLMRGALDNGLMRGASDNALMRGVPPAYSEAISEPPERTKGWAARPISATTRAVPSPVNGLAHELAHASAHASPKMPQTQAQAAQQRAYDKARFFVPSYSGFILVYYCFFKSIKYHYL